MDSFFLNLNLPAASNTTRATLTAAKQVFHSLHVMVCLLMSPDDGSSDAIDAHVKLFLSCCNRFVISYRGKDAVPFWSTTGNFPSLLNLGTQIREYGSVRLYWGGTRERFIQTVKKWLVSMRCSTSYFKRKMIMVQKLVVMDWLKRHVR